jgi:mono/diheme cytochrome c family protein
MKSAALPALLLAASLAAALAAAAPQDAAEHAAHDHSAHEHSIDDRGVFSAIAQAPLKSRDWRNPYEGDADALLAGKKLFLQHCSECHGENARGLGHAVNLHLPGVQNSTPGELVWFLRNGNLAHGMPSWSGLPIQRRWQIVTYLKSFRH